MPEYWDDKFDYLRNSRGLYHNEDYWRFLVRDVWRSDGRAQRIVDFGCGFGWGGMFLLPMMAAGSEYVGIDISEPLLARGHEVFAGLPYRAQLVRGDACAAPFEDGEFDIAFAHTLLMHLPDPRRALNEMIRVTRDGGIVIACEVSRNAINAMIHVEEIDEQEHAALGMFQAMNANIRRRTGMDYNIGMKVPVMMRQAGLVDVEARVSDAIRTSFPPLDTPEKQRVFDAICDDGLGWWRGDEASYQTALSSMVANGVPENDAKAELRREIENDYRRKGRTYHIAQPGLITVSYGKVRKQ